MIDIPFESALTPSAIETRSSIPMVYDKHQNQRDWAWLISRYGDIRYLRASGSSKFKLIRVYETEGPAVISVTVMDGEGNPQAYQPVANRWPDNSLPEVIGAKTAWYERALRQNTNRDGVVGFGLGGGSYYSPSVNNRGPHTIWVLSPTLASDGIDGIGMLHGTNHAGPLHLVFAIVEGGVPISPVPPEPPGDMEALFQRVDELESTVLYLGEQADRMVLAIRDALDNFLDGS